MDIHSVASTAVPHKLSFGHAINQIAVTLLVLVVYPAGGRFTEGSLTFFITASLDRHVGPVRRRRRLKFHTASIRIITGIEIGVCPVTNIAFKHPSSCCGCHAVLHLHICPVQCVTQKYCTARFSGFTICNTINEGNVFPEASFGVLLENRTRTVPSRNLQHYNTTSGLAAPLLMARHLPVQPLVPVWCHPLLLCTC